MKRTVFVILSALFISFQYGYSQEIPVNAKSSDFIGKSVPDFKMKDINGNLISSDDTKGKVVVLNFWFAACKPCINEIPELNEVYEKYKTNTNVVFASITFDKRDRVNAFLKKYPIQYPVVSDAKEICSLFKTTGYPTNIVIDKNGKYFDYTRGGFSKIGHQISSAIQNALEGKKPVLNSAPAGSIVFDNNSTFKLENGDIIHYEEAIKLLSSNNYNLEQKKDENNKTYYLFKKKR